MKSKGPSAPAPVPHTPAPKELDNRRREAMGKPMIPSGMFECKYCKKILSQSLFENKDAPCVYCLTSHEHDEATHGVETELPEPVQPQKLPKKARSLSEREMVELELASRSLARKHLLPFVERFNPKYDAGWVHKDICRRLEKFSQDVKDKKSPRLMLFMPPRHGKSTLASIGFPAYHLGNNPDHEIIACSYSGSLAMGFSRKVRAFLRDPTYHVLYPDAELDPESQSAESWNTTLGGGYVAAGVGGGITGKGAHVLIIDDPVKNREEAESVTLREATMDWYTSTAYTRLAPGGGILIILTRWHDDDMAGQLLRDAENGGEPWEVVCYPARAVEDETYRNKGEPLHAERYNEEALRRIERAVGPRDWAALYQQNPVPDQGAYFTKEMIKYYDTSTLDHKNLKFYSAWDLAIGQKEGNDYTVGVTVGVDRLDNLYLAGLTKRRMQSLDIVENILDNYVLWKPAVTGIERGHIEMSIGPLLEKRIRERNLYECYIKPLPPGRRDKELRARAIQGRMQQGKVFFPRDASFTSDLVAEMLRFPNAQHDDQVDALAWIGLMLAELHALPEEGKAKTKSWKDKLDMIGRTVQRPHSSAMSA